MRLVHSLTTPLSCFKVWSLISDWQSDCWAGEGSGCKTQKSPGYWSRFLLWSMWANNTNTIWARNRNTTTHWYNPSLNGNSRGSDTVLNSLTALYNLNQDLKILNMILEHWTIVQKRLTNSDPNCKCRRLKLVLKWLALLWKKTLCPKLASFV